MRAFPGGPGYLCVVLTFDGKLRRLRAHRIIFALTYGYWPNNDVDHANGVR